MSTIVIIAVLVLLAGARAHITAWSKGMYCKNGLSKVDVPNAAFPAWPLWNLTTKDWFMHGQCRSYPPPKGEFLNVPANGKFTVELAGNRGVTTLSYDGLKATLWPDGEIHPLNWNSNILDPAFPPSSPGCLGSPNLHTHAKADAAGTAFAISYKGNGNINAVTLADFTVFSILPNSPYRRLATYSVPNLPACPKDGCLCAWGWVPNHCGLSNMYMNAFRCKVTNAKKTARAVAAPKPPVWCEGNPSACVKGPKQLLAIYQATGNNIFVAPGTKQLDGQWASPGYNSKVGFKPGAQTDIFVSVTKKASLAAAATETDSPSTSNNSVAVHRRKAASGAVIGRRSSHRL